MTDWSVAMTMPCCEAKASADLSSVGVPSFFPRFLTTEAVRGTIVERHRPLFPSYLFVERVGCWIAAVARFDRHLLHYVMSGDEPARVDGTIISELRERAGPDGFIRLEARRPRRFKNGSLVRVKQGALIGLSGIVTGMSGIERVRILLDMLGRKTPVTLREAELQAA